MGIKNRLDKLYKEIGIKRIPECEPTPIEWLLDLYYGNLSPIERKELAEKIREHEEANNLHPTIDYDAFLQDHKAEVELMVKHLDQLYPLREPLNIDELEE